MTPWPLVGSWLLQHATIFSLSVTGINQLTSFYFDQESLILLSGTVTGSLFICSKMVRYTASICLSIVPSGLDLFIAQPMNLVETPCLLSQCFWPRLFACSANLPAKTPCLLSQSSGQDSLLDLAYLSSPIHGIAPWPATIIMTIAPHSIGP
jgi:hypothetical protein